MEPDRIQRALRQHLRTDQLLGIEAVPYLIEIDPLALDNTRTVRQTPEPPQSSAQTPPTAQPAAAPPREKQAASAPAQPAHKVQLPQTIPAEPEQKQALLDAIDQREVRGCTLCDLCQGRTQTVFGTGEPDADIMFVGEGPGREEDLKGLPFVGRSGELLDRQIQAMGQYAKLENFSRKQVYIANVVKCRPPQNRTPTPDEADICWDYLARQIAIIQPKVIITLGGPAAKRLLNTTTGITRLRGQWQQCQVYGRTVPVMPTFHPAYILRSYTRDNRMKVWNDLQAAMDRAMQQ